MDDRERRVRVEALFAAYASAVLAYARRRTDAASAEDVLGDVFVVAWRRLEEIPPDALPWLLGCARYVLRQARRSEARRWSLIARLAATTPSSRPPAEPGGGALAAGLAALTDRDREALLLVAWDGLSGEQAAKVMGCSANAFSMRLHRARKRLATHLDGVDEPQPRPLVEACND